MFSQRMCQHSLAAGLPVTHTVTVCDLGPVTDSRAGRQAGEVKMICVCRLVFIITSRPCV